MKRRVGSAALVLALSILWASCGDDDPTTRTDAGETLTRAWQSYGKGEYSAALLDFERAAKLDPSLADAHNGLGWVHLSLVDGTPSDQGTDLAVASFTSSLRQDSRHADAWVGLGQALFLRRRMPSDYADAARALASAQKGDPKSLYRHDYTSASDVLGLQAWCYYYAGEREAARASAQAALELDPNAAAARQLIDLSP